MDEMEKLKILDELEKRFLKKVEEFDKRSISLIVATTKTACIQAVEEVFDQPCGFATKDEIIEAIRKV